MLYRSKAKEDWRRWTWNRIVERIPKVAKDGLRRSDACVLYLVGPEDLDRPIAEDKGFRSFNLIAVDIDTECVSKVRKSGNLAICARLEDLLAAWPSDWPIDAIVADFTCGLDNKTAKIFQAALFICRGIKLGHTVIAVNLQRGRDADSNPLRRGIADAMAHPIRKVLLNKAHEISPGFNQIANILTDTLHRGKQFVNSFMCHCLRSVEGHKLWRLDYPDRFMEATKPVFNSYRQQERMPFMDSVVFTMPFGMRSDYNAMLDVYREMAKRDPCKTAARIAALRAVRTMKIKKTL